MFDDAEIEGFDDLILVLSFQQVTTVFEIHKQVVISSSLGQECQIVDLVLFGISMFLLVRVDILSPSAKTRMIMTPRRLTESTLSGSTPSHPFSRAALIRPVMTFSTLAIQLDEWISNHHSFQSDILLSLVEQAVSDNLAPLHTQEGSKANASSLFHQHVFKIVSSTGATHLPGSQVPAEK